MDKSWIETGFRRMEALSLRCRAVDIKGGRVSLDDIKSGSQVRAVGAAALVALDCQSECFLGLGISGRLRRWAFHRPAKSVGAALHCRRIGDVSLHTLRHTFASVAADEGFSELTVAALLGHARRGVTQRYAKVDRAAVLAANAVSTKIARLLAGQTMEADVVSLLRA